MLPSKLGADSNIGMLFIRTGANPAAFRQDLRIFQSFM